MIQDDKYYNAVSVGLGCLGIIYSVIIEVTEAFYLKEERSLASWKSEKINLIKGDVFKNNFHYELMINPHPGKDGDHLCVITVRNVYKPNGSEKN
ncbi:MAG: hypothetical protein IPO92_02440 [Saprospiraceae bacterium]|nr:hypothetical protein [Saprospiraceae bacterium]